MGRAAIVSELDDTFVVAQITKMNRLTASAASGCSLLMTSEQKIKTEQELRNRKECAAKQFINAFKNCHLIRICVNIHYRTESCKNCKLVNPFEMANESNSNKSSTQGDGEVPVPTNPIDLSSTEDGENEPRKTDKANSQEMETQEPQSSCANGHKSGRAKDAVIHSPQTISCPNQGSVIKQDTTVTRHNIRPLRERRPPKFLRDRLFTSVVTGGAPSVNVVRQ